tara:strand:+ start:1078 stop:1323 length:246 start_codon:yes stop_codon:yes gene_type:complete
MIKFLKTLKNWVSPNYWADRWAAKTGLYDSAENSRLRQWIDRNIKAGTWQWWLYQLGVGIIVFAIIEALLNTIGMTILPWR